MDKKDTKIKSSQGIAKNTEMNQFSWTADKSKSLHWGMQTGHNKVAPAYITASSAIWLTLSCCELCNYVEIRL